MWNIVTQHLLGQSTSTYVPIFAGAAQRRLDSYIPPHIVHIFAPHRTPDQSGEQSGQSSRVR
jgi:hypothetical protein